MGQQLCVFWWGQGCQSWRKSPLDMVSSLRTSAKRDSGGSDWELRYGTARHLPLAPAHTVPAPEIYFLKTNNSSLVAPGASDAKAKAGRHDSRNRSSSVNGTFLGLLFYPLPQAARFPLPNGSVYASGSKPLPLESWGWNACLAQAKRILGHTSLSLPCLGAGRGLIDLLLVEEWTHAFAGDGGFRGVASSLWLQEDRKSCSAFLVLHSPIPFPLSIYQLVRLIFNFFKQS